MTLSERLAGAVVPGGSDRRAGAAGTRLRKWRNHVANGDAGRFEKRLHWDGLDTQSALELLGPVRLKNPLELPDWATFLDAAVSGPCFDRTDAARDAHNPHVRQPFEDLLCRFVPEASRRMRAGLGPLQDRLSPAALFDLERGLLGGMCRTAARTLCTEFDVFRAAHAGHPATGRGERVERGRTVYRDFVHAMDGAGLMDWLLRYPMLGRLLATGCLQWIAATVKLLRRLDRDADAIRSTFGIQDRPLHVAGVAPALSDPHRGGQTVCVLRLDSGTGLVYKPRPLAIERHFSTLLDEITDTCRLSVTRRLQVLDRGDYGWVELVEAAPCADRPAVERFYRRAGMLTCLAYALGGADLHAGNLIAAGEHPVPIDLECIVGAPLAPSLRRDTVEPTRNESPAGSVLGTGMPPAARRGIDGAFRVVGGLAEPEPLPTPGHGVVHTNTDWMAWRGRGTGSQPERNVPTLGGRPQPASNHVDSLLAGFRSMHDALSRNRARLGSSDAVRRLEREEFRVLIRDTRSYAALLENALSPQHVTSGPDWSIALDILVAPNLAGAERPLCWATRIVERTELEGLDIPLFAGRMDQRALRSSAGLRLEERLDRTGRAASTRLALLNPDDREQQLGLLRMSFSIASVKRRHRARRVRAAGLPRAETMRQRALAEVHAIVDLLKQLVIDEGDNAVWHGLGGPSRITPTLEPVGFSLFSGTSEIGLFLGAVAAVTARADAGELAARAFDPLCRRFGSRARGLALAAEVGIGGATGVGGLIYALARASRSLGNPSYLAAACEAAHGITQSTIGRNKALDVMSGTAGALLGLLVLHAMQDDRLLLRRAVVCGEHLLARRATDPETGLRAWRSPRGRIATGFAHGTAGIACALRRLARVTGEEKFRCGAEEAWALEHRHLTRHDPASGEPGLTTPDLSSAWPRSWCRGWAGVGLARLDALDDDNPEARSTVETALGVMAGQEHAETDGLCCGRLGRADFLFSAGLRIGRRELWKTALNLGSRTVARALLEGRYVVGTDEGFVPGLFQGASGVGYELLRMHAPDTVPSVLSWE